LQQEFVTMLRHSLVLFAGLWAAAPGAAATWADGLFEELSKDFGSVPRGPTLRHPFHVVNNTGSPVNISNVRVSCGCVSATALKGYLRPGEDTYVVAYMDTTRFTGLKSVTIYVTFDRPSFEEVRLWVQANGRNDFAVTPDTLAFGIHKRATEPSVSVLVTFYGNGQAQVTEAKCESNYILPTVKEVRRQENEVAYQVTTQLRADAPVGKWFTDVWLRTNDPATPPIRVPLTVEIESALTVSPDPVALGTVKLAAESERRIIVRGSKPFKITKVIGAKDGLTVRDNTDDSKPVHVLTVKLKPERAGEINRTLQLWTDLPEDNQIDFQVSAVVAP
jgi:hypothetical protein